MGKRIVVVGAGAVGGYTGAHMAKAGEDVTFIDFWPENVAAIKATAFASPIIRGRSRSRSRCARCT
jgi:ketopantoate reductase